MCRLAPFLCSIFCILLIASGCTSIQVVKDPTLLSPTVNDILSRHAQLAASTTVSQLMQVTIRAPKVSKRFNVELYHSGGATVFYCGGFVGKGSFKGVIRDSTIAVYLLKEREYFEGLIPDLSTADLARYGSGIALISSLLAGDLLVRGVAGSDSLIEWYHEFSIRGSRVKKATYRSRSDSIVVEADLGMHQDNFPYYQIKQCRIIDFSENARVKLKLIEQRCGDVPSTKLAMPNVTDWKRIDRLEFD